MHVPTNMPKILAVNPNITQKMHPLLGQYFNEVGLKEQQMLFSSFSSSLFGYVENVTLLSTTVQYKGISSRDAKSSSCKHESKDILSSFSSYTNEPKNLLCSFPFVSGILQSLKLPQSKKPKFFNAFTFIILFMFCLYRFLL